MNRKIRTWVEISLNDLEHNYREISSRLPDGCQMLGVCKANAYGHGAVRVAQRLQRAGCQWVAVNCYDEAEELRAAGVTMNILLLGPQSANIAVDLATLGVTQAVGSIEYARELNRFLAGTGLRLDAHMKLETGMGRTGFDVHDDSHLDEMIEALSLPHLNFTGVFTHFAVSDENGDPYTQLQFSRFTHAIERMEQATGHHFAIRHCANSGAVINYPEMHLDMVRPGLLLYGVFPAKETGGLDLRRPHVHLPAGYAPGRAAGRLCRRAAAQPLRQGRRAAARSARAAGRPHLHGYVHGRRHGHPRGAARRRGHDLWP